METLLFKNNYITNILSSILFTFPNSQPTSTYMTNSNILYYLEIHTTQQRYKLPQSDQMNKSKRSDVVLNKVRKRFIENKITTSQLSLHYKIKNFFLIYSDITGINIPVEFAVCFLGMPHEASNLFHFIFFKIHQLQYGCYLFPKFR